MPAKSVPTNGAVIRALREAYGLSREEVATAAGISRDHLSNLENGHRDGSFQTLRRIAERLHVPLDAVVRCKVPESMAAA